MLVRTVDVVIARPRDEVFTFVADARNRPLWDDSVYSEELTSPEPIGVGTTVHTKLRAGGKDEEYTWVIVEHVPPERLRVDSTSGRMNITLAFAVQDAGDAGTRVHFAMTCQPRGFFRVAQPIVGLIIQRNLNRVFPRLKQLMESGSLDSDQARV